MVNEKMSNFLCYSKDSCEINRYFLFVSELTFAGVNEQTELNSYRNLNKNFNKILIFSINIFSL